MISTKVLNRMEMSRDALAEPDATEDDEIVE